MEACAHDGSRRGAFCGLLAAGLFGVSAPIAKRLLPETGPLVLASLLYLGAGLALSLVLAGRRRPPSEPPLARADLPLLGVIMVAGGVLGPILMLVGLAHTSGVAGALLLNLEGVFTIALAVWFFGEHLDRHAVPAAALVLAGGVALAWPTGTGAPEPLGALALAGACTCWALDNNLTQRLSLRDPVALVRVKALGAGTGTLLLALVLDGRFPAVPVAGAALALGAVSYGSSIVLDTYALRHVGAAREAAYFATAPFFGALVAVPLLGESLGPSELLAGASMAGGVALLVRARHSHVHPHDAMVHDHLHRHDDPHHAHVHEPPMPADATHSHVHSHASLVHDHPHVPDAHHRHSHRPARGTG